MHVATIYSDWGYFCTIEVPSGPVAALLPEGVPMREVRPGVAELMFNVVRFASGDETVPLEPLWQIDLGVRLEPDNRAFPKGPEALGACCVIHVSSASAAYNAECARRSYPVFGGTRLRCTPSAAGYGVRVEDDAGLIAELAPLPEPAEWTAFGKAGQDVVRDEIGVVRINYVFSGTRTVHLGAAPADAIRWTEHPFFRGLKLEGAATVVHRMALQSGRRHALAFHKSDLPQ